MFNTSLTLDENLETWNRVNLNDSYTLEDFLKKNKSLTAFCHTFKSLFSDGPKNFSTAETNQVSVFDPVRNADLLNQLRNCFNMTTVTPAEEYWECVKFIEIFYFANYLLVGMLL